MKIVVFGAGAIGSLFGALLAGKNTVILVGRRPHVSRIIEKGLIVKGNTNLSVRVLAVESTQDVPFLPDLILLTVKSYDTKTASRQLLPIIQKQTMVVSLQNGLDNINIIEQHIDKNQVLAGVTTQGSLFSKPGEIIHTGRGKTILGELDGCHSERLERLVTLFNEAGIETKRSDDIQREIWMKGIINSSINPLTAFLRCTNGYLLHNPLLEKIVEYVCRESVHIAASEGITVSSEEMIEKTKEVIRDTSQNYSSMFQSIQQGKKTEIESINGIFSRTALVHNIDGSLNNILFQLISSLELHRQS
ncbi:MAG: 2-dehydropantoate 2-reductase [Candidatus Thermoplasmatota archaeon]|nr:2-dehydropantoate 2-reductase [Candidatus Thermoplasmatota archaeon]